MEPQDNGNHEPDGPDPTAPHTSTHVAVKSAGEESVGALLRELRASEKSRRLDLAIERVLRAHRPSDETDRRGERLAS
jgi:hypothetical protein